MTKKIESGKVRLIKGSVRFFWEELKTMNRMKLRALMRIFSGYLRMRSQNNKRLASRRNLNHLSIDEN